MWQDYEASYRDALDDPEFLAWRESGARRKAQNIANVCHGIRAVSVIEIGCGTGTVLRMLHAMKFAEEYFCVDLSASAVQFARDSCHTFLNHAVVGRADTLPFRDRAFSVAILTHVIEHLDDPLSALWEASRIARFVVVEVPTEKVFSNFVRTKMLGQPYPSLTGAGHVQFWSPSSIAMFLKREAGLKILARHRDLLSEDLDSQTGNGSKAKQYLKRSLRGMLPGFIYSHLLTTHATFLCESSGDRP
jgi:SAM-dependent methyltransferase